MQTAKTESERPVRRVLNCFLSRFQMTTLLPLPANAIVFPSNETSGASFAVERSPKYGDLSSLIPFPRLSSEWKEHYDLVLDLFFRHALRDEQDVVDGRT